ncbi:hypothetical protein DENSPDRAFT_691681 [Dentipellis sp. KUC8613]|nr:hypothetical protein DENSPDRAFT_691681 [Dentipellis sp. KUC8613]
MKAMKDETLVLFRNKGAVAGRLSYSSSISPGWVRVYIATMGTLRTLKPSYGNFPHISCNSSPCSRRILVPPSLEVKVIDWYSTMPMATPDSSPAFTTHPANASPVLVYRRPKERPKGSLPIYSRPRPYGLPSPPHALRTSSLSKSQRVGKGVSRGTNSLLKFTEMTMKGKN